MKKVSIIIPVYKVENYLSRCIGSVLAQEYSDFEVILVDDGSPDRSGEICNAYAQKDRRISVIHKQNGGLSSARNAGIDAATGEYLFFLDSDDVIHPQALEILYQGIRETGTEILVGDFFRFHDKDVLHFEKPDRIAFEVLDEREILGRLCTAQQGYANLVSVCGSLFSRKLFENLRFPEGRLFEDEFVTYRLYHKAQKVGLVNIDLYWYYVNNCGITQNLSLQKRFDEYDAQMQRIQDLHNWNLDKQYHQALMLFLKSAQWDLISVRKKSEEFDQNKGENFEQQYKNVFHQAKKERLLDFIQHYDYFVLAEPEKVLYYRMKRLVWKCFKHFHSKMK